MYMPNCRFGRTQNFRTMAKDGGMARESNVEGHQYYCTATLVRISNSDTHSNYCICQHTFNCLLQSPHIQDKMCGCPHLIECNRFEGQNQQESSCKLPAVFWHTFVKRQHRWPLDFGHFERLGGSDSGCSWGKRGVNRCSSTEDLLRFIKIN